MVLRHREKERYGDMNENEYGLVAQLFEKGPRIKEDKEEK